ncbi:hypothetical protein Hanom_Chr00s000004g01606921 [Helianthus anomalus]
MTLPNGGPTIIQSDLSTILILSESPSLMVTVELHTPIMTLPNGGSTIIQSNLITVLTQNISETN